MSHGIHCKSITEVKPPSLKNSCCSFYFILLLFYLFCVIFLFDCILFFILNVIF